MVTLWVWIWTNVGFLKIKKSLKEGNDICNEKRDVRMNVQWTMMFSKSFLLQRFLHELPENKETFYSGESEGCKCKVSKGDPLLSVLLCAKAKKQT